MYVTGAIMVPHPPLIIPEVGRGQELATAIRISNSLDIGLDMLIYDKHFPEKLFILHYIDNCNNWYSSFPDEKKDQISGLLEELWEVIDK